MTAATVLSEEETWFPGSRVVRLTTTGTTSTYICPFFAEIVAVVANNESDDDGVGIGVSSQTITITVGTSSDVVTLFIVGRK